VGFWVVNIRFVIRGRVNVSQINRCPFCKSDKVEFKWKAYMSVGLVACQNWEGECCAKGPEEHYKKYDNEQRIINRAVKKWNKSKYCRK